VPFFCVLTALSYIKGLIVEDWVNCQASLLEQQVNMTQTPHITEANKVLWTEFKTAFQLARKDTVKTQSTYDQLMKLQMKDLEIDAYNAMFE
jgi:hypothetical protein